MIAAGRILVDMSTIAPLASQVMEIMQALKVDGKAGNDHSGIVQYYEKMARFEARKK